MSTLKTLKDVLVDGSTYEISLTKLMGSPVADVIGYISAEFGDPCFKMTAVVLADGRKFYTEGEHDLPYLTDGPAGAKFDEEQLEALYKEMP